MNGHVNIVFDHFNIFGAISVSLLATEMYVLIKAIVELKEKEEAFSQTACKAGDELFNFIGFSHGNILSMPAKMSVRFQPSSSKTLNL
jgi:hypothetical protein